MLVYRLEKDIQIGNKTVGVGPFCAEVWVPEVRPATDQYKRVLGWVNEPQEDGIKYHMGEEIRCGFIDQIQADRWMSGGYVLRGLMEVGFRVREYEVPIEHLRVGYTQVIWTASEGKLIRDIDPDEIEDLLPIEHSLPRPEKVVKEKPESSYFDSKAKKIPYSKRILDRVRYNRI